MKLQKRSANLTVFCDSWLPASGVGMYGLLPYLRLYFLRREHIGFCIPRLRLYSNLDRYRQFFGERLRLFYQKIVDIDTYFKAFIR